MVIGIPSGITQVERRAVIDSAYRAKVSEVHLVEEGIAAAIGAGLPVTDARGSMVVDIGGGTTDIAVVALGGMVYDRSVRTAGHHMDEAIIQFMRRQHGLLIGERTAEQVKIEIGSAATEVEPLNMEVRGRCLREGRPRVVRRRCGSPRGAGRAGEGSSRRSRGARRIPPEIAADVFDNGIVDHRRRRAAARPRRAAAPGDRRAGAIADEPLTSVVRGVGQMLGRRRAAAARAAGCLSVTKSRRTSIGVDRKLAPVCNSAIATIQPCIRGCPLPRRTTSSARQYTTAMSDEMRPARLWRSLPSDLRVTAATAFWTDEQAALEQAEAVALIARQIKFRPKSVITLPVEKKAKHLAGMAQVSDLLAARLLVAYHLQHQRPMMGRFLDELGIAHDNGPDHRRITRAARTADARQGRQDAGGGVPEG